MRIHKWVVIFFLQLFCVFLLFGSLQAQETDRSASSVQKRAKMSRKKAKRAKAKWKKKGRKAARKETPPVSEMEESIDENGSSDDQQVRSKVDKGAESDIDAIEDDMSGGAEGDMAATGSGMRHSRHMEFDARLIKGETAGSGAVILFDRGTRHLPRLTKRRTKFLDATIKPVLGEHPIVPPKKEAPESIENQPNKEKDSKSL